MVRPLPPKSSPLTKRRLLGLLGSVAALSSTGLLGYRLFVSTPQYKGPARDMTGKTVVVTEATSRASQTLLRHLASLGAHLVLTSASVDGCATTRDKLIRATKVSATHIECRRLELDSSLSIRRFAANLLADHPHIDSVIIQPPGCITGIVAGVRRPTHDGFEHQLGRDYFSTFLLSRLIWPRLDSSHGRLVLVVDTNAAEKAEQDAIQQSGNGKAQLPLDDINWESEANFTPKKAYQRANWFLLMFANELVRRSTSEAYASVLVADPRMSLSTAPSLSESDEKQFSPLVLIHRLADWCARLFARRTTATSLMCVIAEPSRVELTGQYTFPPDQISLPIPAAPIRAPVYQDLRLLVSSNQADATVEVASEAQSLLWKLSDKWTRLDTHPTPLPLPIRLSRNRDLANTSDSLPI